MHVKIFPFFSVLAQGTISDLVCQIFDIKYDFFGVVVSNMAKVWIVLMIAHMKLWNYAICTLHILW